MKKTVKTIDISENWEIWQSIEADVAKWVNSNWDTQTREDILSSGCIKFVETNSNNNSNNSDLSRGQYIRYAQLCCKCSARDMRQTGTWSRQNDDNTEIRLIDEEVSNYLYLQTKRDNLHLQSRMEMLEQAISAKHVDSSVKTFVGLLLEGWSQDEAGQELGWCSNRIQTIFGEIGRMITGHKVSKYAMKAATAGHEGQLSLF